MGSSPEKSADRKGVDFEMIYFYARVSSKDQNLARQLEAAKKYKQVDRVFCDKQSGKDYDRAHYQEMKSALVRGDEVVVLSLDRLGRDKKATKVELEWFKNNGIILRIVDMPTTMHEYPQGQEWVIEMVNSILIEVYTSFAEEERRRIRERQAEGIAAKRNSDSWDEYGRPKKQLPLFQSFLERHRKGELTVDECCAGLGISRSTWYSRLKAKA